MAGLFEAEGRTGRPLLWAVRWEQLRRQLLAILDADEQLRAEGAMVPVAVELLFGVDDDPPVVLDVGDDRRVAFRGMIDRVDRSTDGKRLLVVDYKTGSDRGYDIDVDMTGRGQKLQLGVYALAARREHPDADEVEARYWFLDRTGARSWRGGVFDDAAEARFRHVIATIVDGIVGGRFPANPGDESWDRGRYVHEHCTWCEYDRVCPTTRGWNWQQARAEPALAAYVDLAEGPVVEAEAEASSP
jgi:ATP-dependent helicase/nuclease subunit B